MDRTTAAKLRRAPTLADFDAIDQSDLPIHLKQHAKAWRARLEREHVDDPARERRERLQASAREQDRQKA